MVLGFVGWMLATASAHAQGTSLNIYETLHTGTGSNLVTSTQTFYADAFQPGYELQFAFGFATDETGAAGQFLDSATVTLQSEDGTVTLVYLTMDSTGIVWAPVSPGTLFLDPSSITRTTLAYNDPNHAWASQSAYSVLAPIPAQFIGKKVNLYLDLFDNGNPTASQTWITAVPEPGCGALLLAGGLLWLARAAGRRRN